MTALDERAVQELREWLSRFGRWGLGFRGDIAVERSIADTVPDREIVAEARAFLEAKP